MGMTEQELEEARKRLEEKDPEEFKGWETGYRGWQLRFKEGEPRLGSVSMSGVWEPGREGEVVSDWDPEGDEPFETTQRGLYSLKSLEDVKSKYPGQDVYGAITPYGKTFHGTMGYRSEKAMVRALFKDLKPCYICQKPAKYYIHNDERFALCTKCLERLKKVIESKGYTEEDVDYILNRLAEIYDADIAEAP